MGDHIVSFWIRSGETIIWAYSFAGGKTTGFTLFKSIFLRNRSLSNAKWFYGKKRKIWKGNLYLTENYVGTKNGVLWLIKIIYVTYVQKDL